MVTTVIHSSSHFSAAMDRAVRWSAAGFVSFVGFVTLVMVAICGAAVAHAAPADLSAIRARVREAMTPLDVRRAAAHELVASGREAIAAEVDPVRRAALLLDQAEDLLLLVMPFDGEDLSAIFGRPSTDELARAVRWTRDALAGVQEAERLAPIAAGVRGEGGDPPDVAQRRRRFLLAVAMAMAAELDDPLVGGTRDGVGDSAVAARGQMRREAAAILAPMLIDLESTPRRIARDHLALCLAGTGQLDEASQLVRAAEGDVGATDRERLRSALVGVRVVERGLRGADAVADASRRLELAAGARSTGHLAGRLLVADARSRLALVEPGSPSRRVDRAVAPYRALVATAGPGERDAARSAAMGRIASLAATAEDPSALPPLATIALAAVRTADGERRGGWMDELRELLQREDVPALERLVAARALAEGLVGDEDFAGAARLLHAEAAAAPHEPDAVAAIQEAAHAAHAALAFGTATVAAQPAGGAPAAMELLRRIYDTMFEGFKELPDRDRWRVESARLWLQQDGATQALDDVRQIANTSAWWPAARVVGAAAMVEQARRAAAADRPMSWRAAIAECDSALLALAGIGEDDPRHPTAREAAIFVGVLRASAMAEVGDTAGALRAIDEATRGEVPSSVADEADRARLRILHAAGRGDEVATLGRTFLRRSPGAATEAMVGLLEAERERVESLLDEGRDDEARSRAIDAMLPIAAGLDDARFRVEGDPFSDPAEPRSAVESSARAEWLTAEAFRLAGRHDRALARFELLLGQRPDAVELLAAKADCLAHAPSTATPGETDDGAAARRDERLAEAMTILKRIAAGRRAARDRWFWFAETLQLEILRAAERNTEQIAPRVEQLRAIDPMLGGERWRRRLETVAVGQPSR